MLYFCATHNNFTICVHHISGIKNDIADDILIFSTTDSEEWHQMPIHNPTLFLLVLNKSSPLPPAIQVSWYALSTQRTYQSGLNACL